MVIGIPVFSFLPLRGREAEKNIDFIFKRITIANCLIPARELFAPAETQRNREKLLMIDFFLLFVYPASDGLSAY